MPPQNRAVFLPVCVLPGDRVAEVRLESETRAADVVSACLSELRPQLKPSFSPKDPSDADPSAWTLVADFKGFEKRFAPEERLYQLVRKHILLAENVDGVRFYLQKKKKRYASKLSLVAGFDLPRDALHSSGGLFLDETWLGGGGGSGGYTSDSGLSTRMGGGGSKGHSDQSRARAGVGGGVAGSLPRGMKTSTPTPGSYSSLVRRAEEQRRLLAANSEALAAKEARLRLAAQAPRPGRDVAARIDALRAASAAETAELRRLRAAQARLSLGRTEATAAAAELNSLRASFAANEGELRAAVSRVESLRRELLQLHARRAAAAAAGRQRLAELARAQRPKAAVEPLQRDFVAAFTAAEDLKSLSPLKESTPRSNSASPTKEKTSLASDSASPTDSSDVSETSRVDISDGGGREPAFPDLIPEPPLPHKVATAQSDTLHLRLDNLRAAKRRSWASSSNVDAATMSEADHIRWTLDREEAGKEKPPQMGMAEVRALQPPPPYVHHPPEPAPPAPAKSPPPPSPPDSTAGASSTTCSSPSASDAEAPTPTPKSPSSSSSSSPPRGILRRSPRPHQRRLTFHPLALLLDGALEGELQLVKDSAARLDGAVSKANDEGITALHNAICAGHIEIVEYLVEAGANVNAADSDGWTPLHCAASCNNLPMLRCLVDAGAVVAARTLSDGERAWEKCEEAEEGFQGCRDYLADVAEQMRRAEARVYAAFAYEATREDELSVAEGKAVAVLSATAEGAAELWWQCRDEEGREGFLPANFLGLRPTIAYRSTKKATSLLSTPQTLPTSTAEDLPPTDSH